MEYLLIEKAAWLEIQANVKRMNDRIMELDRRFFPAGKSTWIGNAAVCEYLNISKRTLQYYRNSGILPYTILGNKCYYKLDDVKSMIDRCISKQK